MTISTAKTRQHAVRAYVDMLTDQHRQAQDRARLHWLFGMPRSNSVGQQTPPPGGGG